ncbi:MAG TPA: hypothetical protein VEA38_06480 [Terriglobales bacterium]|nr:hypothetical protein [Terriglobales bacterium]
MLLTHRLGEDHLPGVLHSLLAALGFEEPSWLAVFIVLVGIAFVAVAVCAIRALVDHW